MSFGENLINLRKQKGWSQDDLADNLDLSRQAISKWENDTSKPDIDNIKKISKIFSVTIDDLLNNDVVKDKAVTLNVKKVEKKERITTIVKCMIIAVIILYIINVIFKFASLLIIVNGIQKYANLSNYHYVITTYENNRKINNKEFWCKDGITKSVTLNYEGKDIITNTTIIDYNKKYGYLIDNDNNKTEINLNEYISNNENFYEKNLYYEFPLELRKQSIWMILRESLFINTQIKINNNIEFNSKNLLVELEKSTMLPVLYYVYDKDFEESKVKFFEIEINSVDDLII